MVMAAGPLAGLAQAQGVRDLGTSASDRLAGRLAGARAEPGASPWDASLTSRLRLISGGADPEGTLDAGVEITLDPKWKTYWSTPGDTGIAPVFDFSRSLNVAAVDVSYPMPQRFDLPGDISFGYETRVVFPLSVTPHTAGEPVTLVADVMYGACEELCIPVDAVAQLTFGDTSGESRAFASDIAQWQARVPAGHGAELHSVTTSEVDDAQYLEIEVTAPQDFDTPVLVAEPVGGDGHVYLGTPEVTTDGSSARFIFPVRAHKTRPGLEAGVAFRLTLADMRAAATAEDTKWAQQFDAEILPAPSPGADGAAAP